MYRMLSMGVQIEQGAQYGESLSVLSTHESPEQSVFREWERSAIYQVHRKGYPSYAENGRSFLQNLSDDLERIQALGMDALYMNPIYPSDYDEGYAITDFYAIDSNYGNLEDFDALVEKAHTMGIRIIMDGVFNHTSVNHPWFQEAITSQDNPRHTWYLFHDPLDVDNPAISPPSAKQSTWGRSLWQYIASTQEYCVASFSPFQMDLNWRNQEVREEIMNVIKFWRARGVDGFRLDVINFLGKDALYYDRTGVIPDDASLKDGEAVFVYVEEIARAVGKDGVMLLEVDISQPSTLTSESMNAYHAVAQRLQGEGAQIAPLYFNFYNLEKSWDPREYARFLTQFRQQTNAKGRGGILPLSDHDSGGHIASRIDTQQALMLMANAGLLSKPFLLYYGDEYGAKNRDVTVDEITDPLGRDKARGPLPNQRERYLQETDMSSVYHFTKRLMQVKHALHDVQYTEVFLSEKMFSYVLQHKTGAILVMNNLYDTEENISLQSAGFGEIILSTYRDMGRREDSTIRVRPGECVMVALDTIQIQEQGVA